MNVIISAYDLDANGMEEIDSFSFTVNMSSNIQHALLEGTSGISKIEISCQVKNLCCDHHPCPGENPFLTPTNTNGMTILLYTSFFV